MKRIRISIDAPVIPANSGYVHVSTSFQIASDPEFKPESILAENLKDTNSKLTYKTDLDITNSQLVYVRTKYHFTYKGQEVDSGWSRIAEVNSNMEGLKLSSSIVSTPHIDYTINTDAIDVTTSDFKMFSGPGDHYATSWVIKDMDGYTLFSRADDYDNLSSIQIKNTLDLGKAYTIEASHTNTTNNSSTYGKTILLEGASSIRTSRLFDLEMSSEFTYNRKWYYRIKLFTTQFKHYDIQIRDAANNVIKEKTEQTAVVDNFLLSDMQLFSSYDIYVRLHFENGDKNAWTKVDTRVLTINRVVPYRPNMEYRKKTHMVGAVDTDGLAVVTTRQTYDGDIICTDFKTDRLVLMQMRDDVLYKIKDLYVFEDALEIDYLNMLLLPTGDYVVDVRIHVKDPLPGEKSEKTMFFVFEYNSVTKKFGLLDKVERGNEKYSTSMNNSAVVDSITGVVYYIPAVMIDGEDNIVEQVMKKFFKDTDGKWKVSSPIRIPFEKEIYGNATLMVDHDDNIYVIGGSGQARKDAVTGEEYWYRENNEVFMFDKQSESFRSIGFIPTTWPVEIYSMQPFLRQDGRIVLFNSCHSGKQVKNQDTLLFDPFTRTFVVENTDNNYDLPFRSNIIYNNGSIQRIAYEEIAPAKSYLYVSNIMKDEDIVEIPEVVGDQMHINLVVPDGKVVRAEDLYKYDSITINGNGILRWVRPNGAIELGSKDLIVTRNRSMRESELSSGKYRNIVVLEGVNFTVIKD